MQSPSGRTWPTTQMVRCRLSASTIRAMTLWSRPSFLGLAIWFRFLGQSRIHDGQDPVAAVDRLIEHEAQPRRVFEDDRTGDQGSSRDRSCTSRQMARFRCSALPTMPTKTVADFRSPDSPTSLTVISPATSGDFAADHFADLAFQKFANALMSE